jgi:hypothetical protein
MNVRVEKEILSVIEARAEAQPTAMEFEFGYQVRVACDRIRFAIRQTEQTANSGQAREIAMQLLDALERLESSERRFQVRCRRCTLPLAAAANGELATSFGTDGQRNSQG